MSDPIYFQVTRYSQPVLIIFGTIGSILNQFLFSYRKPLRISSCSLYFRALSANDLLVLYTVVLPLWLGNQFGIDPSGKNNIYCKLKTYLSDSLYTLSPYFVVLACLDRLCTSSTNTRIRRIASIRIASYLIPFMIIFIFVGYFHVPVWYTLVPYNNILYCTSSDPTYSKFLSLYLLFLLCITPPLLMMILCSTTLIFLRQQRRRVMPVNQTRSRQRDNQLLKMLFVYVILNVICTVPFAITYVILVFQLTRYTALHASLFRLFGLLLNVNFSTSFYAYTLGTPSYRHELYNLIKVIRDKLYPRNGIRFNRRSTHGSSGT